jgi:hypothetical protein
VQEGLLAAIQDFVVDEETLVAFMRAYEAAVRIVREGSSDFSSLVARRPRLRRGNRSADKIPCGCLAATSSPAALEARPSPHALTRSFTPLPLARATASAAADPLSPTREFDLAEESFCGD